MSFILYYFASFVFLKKIWKSVKVICYCETLVHMLGSICPSRQTNVDRTKRSVTIKTCPPTKKKKEIIQIIVSHDHKATDDECS